MAELNVRYRLGWIVYAHENAPRRTTLVVLGRDRQKMAFQVGETVCQNTRTPERVCLHIRTLPRSLDSLGCAISTAQRIHHRY